MYIELYDKKYIEIKNIEQRIIKKKNDYQRLKIDEDIFKTPRFQ